jgi:hypothetical protein
MSGTGRISGGKNKSLIEDGLLNLLPRAFVVTFPIGAAPNRFAPREKNLNLPAPSGPLFPMRPMRRPASSVRDEFRGRFNVQLRFNIGSMRIHRLRT